MDLQTHFEEFLHLAGLGHDDALIAWGGFYFRRGDSPYGEWRIVDDQELAAVAPSPRSETIGAGSEPFGHAVVEVERDGRVVARAETGDRNHARVTGLEPDTEYSYRVRVDDREWGAGELRDWSVEQATLVPAGRSCDNRFRTFPAQDSAAPVAFAVLGDYGARPPLRPRDRDRVRLAGSRALLSLPARREPRAHQHRHLDRDRDGRRAPLRRSGAQPLGQGGARGRRPALADPVLPPSAVLRRP